MTDSHVDEILAGWLSGSESAFGMNNPAGPLYLGGEATEAALTNSTDALYTGCSSCTGSLHSYCC
ncbi:hypothetical protein F0U60_47250 [Archangium minus]|uniref:Uncharacterized protein n=1 Tax=Archangium minus TaxID=83450 RepID=A0ABY9X658_9BACT|nr:hypothetical protein F0U61_47370 [Archangium violaceum]WNG50888.1 hypothetical protein F0U60_47250 [Archangium minus]